MRISAIQNYNMSFGASFSKDEDTKNYLKQIAESNPNEVYTAIKVLEGVNSEDVISISILKQDNKGEVRAFKNENTGKSIEISYDKFSKKAVPINKTGTSKRYNNILQAFIGVIKSGSNQEIPFDYVNNVLLKEAFRELFGKDAYFKDIYDLINHRYVRRLSSESGADVYEAKADQNRRDLARLENKIYKTRTEMFSNLDNAKKIKEEYVLSLIG